MKKYILLLVLLASSNFAAAKQEDFRDFAYSLEERYFINSSHILDVTDKVFLARPSLLEQWGVINSDAAASYNARSRGGNLLMADFIAGTSTGNVSQPGMSERTLEKDARCKARSINIRYA